jgi:ribosomal protein S18 acetylase RimI-like enzyme
MADLDLIFTFYDLATAFQKTVSAKHWLGFDRQMVEQEIRENRQWKLMLAGKVAGIFATTFNDVQFWGEKDQQPSIYIHRIVTHPDFRGRSLVRGIIHWAKQFAIENDKQFIRMDTWGDNDKLIAYYQRLGFAYIDTIDLDQTVGLPKHYTGPLALFEIAVN